MLQPIMHILNEKKIVLASGSPSRRNIFENVIGLNVECCSSLFEENLDPKRFDSFSEFVVETALQKVLEVEQRLKAEGRAPDLIIGADTMVTLGQDMFGKPTTEDEAFEMLLSLSGKINTVITGVVIKPKGGKAITFTDSTDVHFGRLTEEQIRGYIATGEPMRMAGAYGIQGRGGTLVERVDGNYYNIMGLPVFKFCNALLSLFNTP